MINAALYIRVSTQEQALEGYSLDAQQGKLEKYAEYQGYNIYGIYRDEGFSASTIHRPALLQLINAVKSGLVNIVIIYKLDRLSRRVKDVLELVDLFEKYNVTLFSLSENIDLSSPFGRAALKISATFSELERETIIERTRLGKEQRVREGKMMYNGNPPFGYRHDNDTDRFIINEPEAEMVRKIFELYLEGYSLRKLYEYCKEAFGHPYFSNPMCCKAILHRPMYGGYFNYKNELYKGTNFEPIISFDTYLRAQKRLEENRTRRTHDNTPYLLTGLLVCAQCGNRYVGKLYERYNKKADGSETKHYKYTAYGCAARVKRDKNYHPARCNNTIYPAKQLDDYVCNAVENLKFDGFIEGEYRSGTIDMLVNENARLKAQIDKLLDLYISDMISKETYQQRASKLENEIDKNSEIINQQSKADIQPNVGIDYIKQRLAGFHDADKKEKRQLLQLLIKQILIDGDNILIEWRVK